MVTLHRPNRRRHIDGTLPSGPATLAWSREDWNALADFFEFSQFKCYFDHDISQKLEEEAEAREDRLLQEAKELFGYIEPRDRTETQISRYGRDSFASSMQLVRGRYGRGDPWFEQAFNAAEALEHTKVITNWDDDIYNSMTTLHRETLDYDIERWKVYVETGEFPPRITSVDPN